MEKLERLKKEREELDKKIETLEYAERIFEEGEEFYFVDEFGNVTCRKWDDLARIDGAFSQGYIFRTEQEAETETKRRNLLTRFRAFRDECNEDWKPKWHDNKPKYFLFFNANDKELQIDRLFNYINLHYFGYFEKAEDAERAIELFGQEIIELYVNKEV
jgi:hypothetical protein|nr:MAG TPA: hypothetical protein [Caudoviricetes sp.]